MRRENTKRIRYDDGINNCDIETWVLVSKPYGVKTVACKWLHKKKGVLGVELPRFKSRLVVRGYTQREGVGFNEIFLLVI